MFVEILLTTVVYPIAKKVGEKWIDRIAAEIDQQLATLLKDAVKDSNKEKDVVIFLKNNEGAAKKLIERIKSIMGTDETASAISTTIVPSPGAKLDYYKLFIEMILKAGSKLSRDIVLKGFFHGEKFLSYFHTHEVDEFTKLSIIDKKLLLLYPSVKIHLEKINDEKERDRKFKEINEKIKISRFGMFEYKDYANLIPVDALYENWVKYKKIGIGNDFLKLTKDIQEEVRINQPGSALRIMNSSLNELIDIEARDLEEIEKVFGEIVRRGK